MDVDPQGSTDRVALVTGAGRRAAIGAAIARRLVAWLVGDEGGWVTGQVIAADGGWSAR